MTFGSKAPREDLVPTPLSAYPITQERIEEIERKAVARLEEANSAGPTETDLFRRRFLEIESVVNRTGHTEAASTYEEALRAIQRILDGKD
jgi:hypothetical protein